MLRALPTTARAVSPACEAAETPPTLAHRYGLRWGASQCVQINRWTSLSSLCAHRALLGSASPARQYGVCLRLSLPTHPPLPRATLSSHLHSWASQRLALSRQALKCRWDQAPSALRHLG